jgi:deazaflavin-dependent oxidoreductase (nitroreductase family)
VTPLQYEEIDGAIYVASARGIKADWFRNILANPHVQVRLKSHQIHARAEPVTEPERIADFLELRLRRHPRMVGAMMRSAGLPPGPDRQQLEAYAANRAMVILRPVEGVEEAGTARAQTGQNGWPNACQLAGRLEQHLAQPIEVITQGHEDEGLPLFLQYSPEE